MRKNRCFSLTPIKHFLMTGYLHPAYAEAFIEFGQPLLLPRSGGHLLTRQISRTDGVDAMGCYPLFACSDWDKLGDDLQDLSERFVSVALVTDPFGDFETKELRDCFPDKMFHFKDHFVVDFDSGNHLDLPGNHRRNLEKALRGIVVEHCDTSRTTLEDWIRLYDVLIARHGIRGLTAFSRDAFERLFAVPGLVVFRAVADGETVGMTLWLTHHDIGYYHLGAYSEHGYDLGASFPIFQTAIEYFREKGLRALNLGAGAGVGAKQQDGLSRFKQGWTNSTKPVYFCGRIFDHARYSKIVSDRGLNANGYFPAYRYGEFQT
jgi:Acetyltransferase (GNAT) domain